MTFQLWKSAAEGLFYPQILKLGDTDISRSPDWVTGGLAFIGACSCRFVYD